MTIKKQTFRKGIVIKPDNAALEGIEGEIKFDSADKKFKTTADSVAREFVDNSTAQTLTNKSIDADNNPISNLETDNLKAGVLNTSATLAGASNTQVPSALAAKDYADSVGSTANTNLNNHINDTTDAHDASAISNVPAGTISATDVQAAINELDGDIQGHINDTADAHDASAISSVPSGNLAATDVQGALNELQSDIDTRATQTALNDHLNDTVDAHDASAISSIPSGNLAATDVQGALNELQTDIDTRATSSALSAHTGASTDVHGIGVGNAVVGTGTSQTLTNKTITGADFRTPIRSDVKQDTKANLTTYATTASNGQLVFATDTKEMFQIVDGILKTVGGEGGVGGVDILAAQTFDNAALTDFTQTGLSFATIAPIKGSQSALLTHQPAVNQSFKQTISVDRKFRGKSMNLSLYVRSTASQGNLTLNVYDETNAANLIASEQIQTSSNPFTANTSSGSPTLTNISNADMALLQVGEAVSGAGIPTGAVIQSLGTNQVTLNLNATATATGVSLRASALPARYSYSFTIPASSSSISYTVTALPEANSPRSVIDDVVIELSETALLETSVEVPVVTAWQGYTPTFQGFGTPTNVEFEWRQNGESVEIRGKFTSGTPTAVEARVGLPAGLTSGGTNLIPSIQMVGKNTRSAAAAVDYSVLVEPSVTYVTFSIQDGTRAGLTKQNGDQLIGSGQAFSFFASVPCAGLSATTTKTIPLTQSGLVQESDSLLRLAGANGYGSTFTVGRRFTSVIEQKGDGFVYSDSPTLGTTITITEDGFYSFSYTDAFTTSAQMGLTLNYAINGSPSTVPNANLIAATYTNTNTFAENVAWSGPLVAGDVIRPITDGTANNGICRFNVARVGVAKQVSVSSDQKITIPTSELRFEGASSRGSTATAIVRFDTLAKIRGDAFTVESDAVLGTRITMRKAGKLDISAAVFTNTNGAQAVISRNQAALTTAPVASESLASAFTSATTLCTMAWSGFVNVGDVLRVYSSVTPTTEARNNLNLSFQEQDISVSVTNTLPQFSESDSSIRLSGANGFGSASSTIRRFSSVINNIGTDIQYVDSPTLGAQFIAQTAGIYSVSYSESSNANNTGFDVGILVNGTQVAYDGEILNTASASSKMGNAAWTGYLAAGDIVTAQGNSSSNGQLCFFTISKVGKPNVTGVDVTPFVNVPQPDSQSYAAQLNASNSPTSIISSYGSGLFTVSVVSSRIRFTALKRISISGSGYRENSSTAPTSSQAEWWINGSLVAIDKNFIGAGGSNQQASDAGVSASLAAGEYVEFAGNIYSGGAFSSAAVSVVATALSDQILTAPESFSTDTANLQYAPSTTYTLTTLANAPVGTYITFTYAANTNTRTQTTTRPTQTDADMNVNGIQMFARAYNANSTAAQPSTVAIQIGKGLKGLSLNLFKSIGKVTNGSIDLYQESSATQYGFSLKEYNESTGILFLDCGYTFLSTIAVNRFFFNDVTAVSNGYLVINASKSPALTGVPVLLPRIATISNVQPSGTGGGGSTASTFVTRPFNTLSDPSGIVTSLASNQFTLPAGEYYINGSYEGYACNHFRTRLRNITAGTDALLGSNGFSSSATPVATVTSTLRGTIVVSSPTTFEVQQWAGGTQAGNGLGTASASGSNEVFGLTQIQKVK